MDKTKGIFYGMMAAFIFGFTPILSKLTYFEGSNFLSLTFYRNLLSVPLLFFMLKYKNISIKIDANEAKKLAVLSSLGPTLTALTLYGSYNYISVGMSTTIHYIYPVLVMTACILIFKEKTNKNKVIALMLSTVGVSLFLEGSFSVFGVFLSFVSGVVYAAHIIYIDKSGLNAMFPFKITFYLSIFSSIYVFMFGLFSRQIVFSMTAYGWFLTILVSFFASFLANTFIPMSIKYAGATSTSIIGMFEPITSILLGILFLREPITFRNISACILILAGVFIVAVTKEKCDSEKKSQLSQ